MTKYIRILFICQCIDLCLLLLGLAMISAIKDFDEDRHESVNMRVGIHTGTVLCGIVGKTIFPQFRRYVSKRISRITSIPNNLFIFSKRQNAVQV